jgi:hypothetical protein
MTTMAEYTEANTAKTHCLRGHEFTPENTRLYRGKRNCRTCGRMYRRGSFDGPARMRIGPKLQPLAERFWPKVDRRGPDECWPWLGATAGSHGYGAISVCTVGFGRKLQRASRVSYVLANGPLEVGMIVRHACDNPPCVNPAHLVSGTQYDNVQDMVERGRVHRQTRRL